MWDAAGAGDEDDNFFSGQEEDHECPGEPAAAAVGGLNVILILSLNLKVVLCDCGRAYKVPEDEMSSALVRPSDLKATSKEEKVVLDLEDETTKLVPK